MKQKCLICECRKHNVISSSIREGAHDVLQCSFCGFVFLQEHEKINYSLDYNSYTFDDNWDLNKALKLRSDSQREVNRIIHSLIIKKMTSDTDIKILEIGPGIGSTIEFLKDRIDSLHIDCVEPNKKCSKTLKKRFMVDVYDDIYSLPSEYDVVYANQLFEHLSDPYVFLNKIFSITKKNAVLYLSFPNLDDCYVRTLPDNNKDKYLNFIFHLAHPYYYTEETFMKVVDKSNWKVNSIKTIQDYSVINYFNWYINGQKSDNIFEATFVAPEISELNDLFVSFSEKNSMGNNISVMLIK